MGITQERFDGSLPNVMCRSLGYVPLYVIPKLEIFLKYTKNGKPVITSLKCLSSPGQRLYYSAKQIWKIDSSKNFIVFSTNTDLKTINQCKKHKIGGEPLVVVK